MDSLRLTRACSSVLTVCGVAVLLFLACTSGSDGAGEGGPPGASENAGSSGETPGDEGQAGETGAGGSPSASGGAGSDQPCVAPDDVKGDCQRTSCHDGVLQTLPDDRDVPDDLNDCTRDECNDGKPGHSPTGPETACGGSGKLKCDGMGKCANCVAAADCGESNPCVTFECVEGTCETHYVPKNDGKLAQTARDCKKNVCNGEGSSIAIADATDLPIDDNPCSKDLCSDTGVPTHPPVAANTACGTDLACDGQGHCACIDPDACSGKCGQLTDACGHSVDCGNPCGGYDTCGGGGVANLCGCTPHTPDCAYAKCGGLYPDGCGQNVPCIHYDPCVGGSCGSCQGYCGGDNICVCDQPPCS